MVLAVWAVAACSGARHEGEIERAEKVMREDPDSTLAILKAIDPDELTADSTRAKYYYVMAYAHEGQSHIALSDSMINFSDDYYRGRDLRRSISSATLLATYRFRVGEREAARRMLDSLLSLDNIPDSLLLEPLRERVHQGTYYESNESLIKRLMAVDKDRGWQSQYEYWLYFNYLFGGRNDSALVVLDNIIDMAARADEPERQFSYEYEKIGVLEETGRYAESLALADSLMKKPWGECMGHYFHLWKSVNEFNMQHYDAAAAELAKADSLAAASEEDEHEYFNSFAYVLHAVLDYRKTGRLRLMQMARLNNRRRDILRDARDIRLEAAREALEIENRRLTLKARNDRQTALLVITVLAALLFSGALIWYALAKKRKALEALERNEILQKLVDESKDTRRDPTANEALRRAMLQQLGIIKMLAETPTEQNREMLRKISSIEKDTKGSLVDWESVYGIIDSLYSGFYTRLHARHGAVLTDKEEQILALMVAGFSTKEISVITGQTVAVIYVRKSAVRKKLGVPEKEDIVAFLHGEAGV